MKQRRGTEDEKIRQDRLLLVLAVAMAIFLAIIATANLVGLARGAEPADGDYAAAREAAIQTGKPLLVLIGAAWCPQCPAVHPDIPELQKRGVFVYLDCDRHRPLLRALRVSEAAVPRLIVWRCRAGVWQRVEYVGVEQIRAFAAGKPAE